MSTAAFHISSLLEKMTSSDKDFRCTPPPAPRASPSRCKARGLLPLPKCQPIPHDHAAPCLFCLLPALSCAPSPQTHSCLVVPTEAPAILP